MFQTKRWKVISLLTNNFETTFSTPESVAKLRDVILTLAMQGKIVEQDPNDYSAIHLLESILDESKNLSGNNKSKRSSELKQTVQNVSPYILPKGWTWSKIGLVGNIFNGNSINPDEKETKYSGVSGIPYIATKDVGYGFDSLDYTNGIYIPSTEKKFRIANEGTVLICSEGGSAGKKCGITNRSICFGNKLFALEPLGGIPPKFILYYYLSPFFRKSFSQVMTGIIGGVSLSKFVELPIPIPPIKEQFRIVNKLDELMEYCDKLDDLFSKREDIRFAVHDATKHFLLEDGNKSKSKAWRFLVNSFNEIYNRRDNISSLRSTILNLAVAGHLSEKKESDRSVEHLLSDIRSERLRLKLRKTVESINSTCPLGYEIPSHWTWLRLEEILTFGPTNGISPRAVNYETNVRSLTLSATTSGVFKEEHSKFIDTEIPEDSHLWLKDGDILVQRGNSLEYVGVPAVYRGKDRIFIYPDLMMKIRVSIHINTDYVYYVMSSEPCRQYLRAHAAGTSITMPKINQKALKNLPIPIPPLDEQKRIVATIKRLLDYCEDLEQHLVSAENKQKEFLDAILAQV